MAGGGGIFAAVSFAAAGDGGAEFVDESSPQPVIAPTKINNAKARTARCMREPPLIGNAADSADKARCWRDRRGSRQHRELVNEQPASRTLPCCSYRTFLVGVAANHFTEVARAERPPDGDADRVFDEFDRAVAKSHVDSARMVTLRGDRSKELARIFTSAERARQAVRRIDVIVRIEPECPRVAAASACAAPVVRPDRD